MDADARSDARQAPAPAGGPGSPAGWGARLGALLIDWSASMLVAMGLFGTAVLTGSGWRTWMTMAVFLVEKSVLTWLAGGSFGQLLTRIRVVRVGGGRPGAWTCLLRSVLVCLVLPAVVIGADRRGLHDVLAATAAVRTR